MPKQTRDENSNEEGPSTGEKPFKKARFVWELKGKNHLKKALLTSSINNNNNKETVDEENNVSTSQNIDTNSAGSENNEQNCKEQHSSRSANCNSCCLQTILDSADDIVIHDKSDEYNFTTASPDSQIQDYYLRKWQARQIARGFVDNTINKVLEAWINRPVDVPRFIESYKNNGEIENDAILMAIHSHGLQSPFGDPLQSSHRSSFTEAEVSLPSTKPDLEQFSQDNLENVENERIKAQEVQSSSTDGSSSPDDGVVANSKEVEEDNTIDFLNAAVSAAIQKKGLSYGY
ncbi:uncharacterized protein LOC126884452 [Diabrotica virgifera virgifera]|uniref:Uncharacterized protein LOC114333126 n=1 Tax=Diabrotica virgifera virgifera TaxID=50390 RepID=A0A6P7FVJ0_DIAVI|nr:uncharacterized protein LOC126884452 [Diabrotica virgifera virgifera]